jgi:hypothetical protein
MGWYCFKISTGHAPDYTNCWRQRALYNVSWKLKLLQESWFAKGGQKSSVKKKIALVEESAEENSKSDGKNSDLNEFDSETEAINKEVRSRL